MAAAAGLVEKKKIVKRYLRILKSQDPVAFPGDQLALEVHHGGGRRALFEPFQILNAHVCACVCHTHTHTGSVYTRVYIYTQGACVSVSVCSVCACVCVCACMCVCACVRLVMVACMGECMYVFMHE